MVKIALISVLVAVVLFGSGAIYVLATSKAPQPEMVVKDIPYESLSSKN